MLEEYEEVGKNILLKSIFRFEFGFMQESHAIRFLNKIIATEIYLFNHLLMFLNSNSYHVRKYLYYIRMYILYNTHISIKYQFINMIYSQGFRFIKSKPKLSVTSQF